ncbi:MAG: S24/S26 family peptidase [Candidatus Limnocylindrales bacterium]
MTIEGRSLARATLFEAYRRDRVTTWIEATGPSMEPLIHPGDRLLVAFGARPERTGQVILCAVDGRFVAHRLVAHRVLTDPAGDPLVRLIAKGDAEALPDRAIAPESVVGIVQAIRRGEDGRRISYGLDDTPSAVVAVVSWWGGRAARRSRRVARHAPPRFGPALLFALLTLSRVPTRVITALMPWLAQETRAEGR